MDFLYSGEIYCETKNDCIRIRENLAKIFGFPKSSNLTILDQVSSDNETIDVVIKQEDAFEDPLEIKDQQNTNNAVLDTESFSFDKNEVHSFEMPENIDDFGHWMTPTPLPLDSYISENINLADSDAFKNSNELSQYTCHECACSFFDKSAFQR